MRKAVIFLSSHYAYFTKNRLSNSLHPGEMAGEQTQAGKNTWRGTRYVGEPNLQR